MLARYRITLWKSEVEAASSMDATRSVSGADVVVEGGFAPYGN